MNLCTKVLLAAFVSLSCAAGSRAGDLTKAVVVAPADLSPQEKKAVEMLVDEVHKRTQVRWHVVANWPAGDGPAVAIGPAKSLAAFAGKFADELAKDASAKPAEGFRLRSGGAQVVIAGNDPRGVLFGIGYLLRHMHMNPGKITLDDDLSVTTAPKYPLRGHQLGYRPKTNSYDAWDLPQWEQYYRDLAVFGCNAVELVPPRTDDDATSPHFPLPPMEMMTGMSRLADEYGLDVWIWYPAMDKDYCGSQNSRIRAWPSGRKSTRQLPRIDAIFVPGGDPGHTQPKYLMALLEKQTELLAQVSSARPRCGFRRKASTRPGSTSSTTSCDREPDWLGGIVFGPQVRVSLPELREAIPARYPIRHYPDITHSRQCQYPVPDWDVAHAVTSSREAINPRPTDQATIFRLLQPYTIGFLTYSEGCNDDVNKSSGAGWAGIPMPSDRHSARVQPLLHRRRLCRQFCPGTVGAGAQLAGRAADQCRRRTTLEQFQAMEKTASPEC